MALFLILLSLFSAITSLPIDDDDVIIIFDDFLNSNRIEGDGEIDVSDLGPQAYGVPKNESGMYLYFQLYLGKLIIHWVGIFIKHGFFQYSGYYVTIIMDDNWLLQWRYRS